MSPKKLKYFILSNSYIVIYKKHQINNINIDIDMSYYRNLSGHEEYEEQQQHSCEILDTSRYVSGNVSDSEESYDWDSLDSCVTPLAVLAVAECTTPPAIKPKQPQSNPQLQHESCFDFDLTDPLRYCLEHGEITHHEYDKWKIVQEEEEPRPQSQSQSQSQSKTRPDFGPGYNSDSDSDDEFTQSEPEPDINYTYGNGYLTRLQHPRHDEFYDPWFPNPDPTPNKQYTAIATNPRYMMVQFVVFESDPNDNHHHPASTSRLNRAFQLKLIWERFIAASNPPPQSPSPSLQTFWQTNALSIYEALQECVATQAKCFSPLSGARKLIPNTPEFHTTPVEMLENTFETIGRMSRCIAEEFNTQPIVNYVDEFIHALYTELRFMELVQGTPSPTGVNPCKTPPMA
jgi:hypothetical protein